jgi:outer membrane lipoprotein SlyB
MGLILSILAGIVGSLAGSVARAGVNLAEQQVRPGSSADEPMMVNASVVGAVASGVVADTVGGGPGLAFWLGAVLGAAGADRLDWWVLKRVGVDRDELIAKARDAAMSKAAEIRGEDTSEAASEADA